MVLRFRLTPMILASRISLAMRLQLTCTPPARSSAWTRGAPYVPCETAWIVRISRKVGSDFAR